MQRNRAMFRIIWTYCALKPRNVGRRHAVNWYFGGRETKCSPFLLVLNCLTKFTILDQELIPYRYPSCSCCSCWGDPLQENLYSVVSNRIGITFGRIVLQANMHPLTESDFLYEIRILRWRPRRHFTQKSAATRWVHTQSLLGTYYAVASASSCSVPVPVRFRICWHKSAFSNEFTAKHMWDKKHRVFNAYGTISHDSIVSMHAHREIDNYSQFVTLLKHRHGNN